MSMSLFHDCRRGIARVVFFLLMALTSTLTLAQDQQPDQKEVHEAIAGQPAHRARIGLALSGGGALGLAEIGVLQWLEEKHIPVDRLARTHHGKLLGGSDA